MGSSLEQLRHAMTNIALPTHPPKTSDWRFAWQMGMEVAPKAIDAYIPAKVIL